MKIEKIKPIPKYMIAKIKKLDKETNSKPNGQTRFYAYLTTNDKELVKVTVAVRHKYSKWYCKQCAIHGVHSEDCFVKDMVYSYVGGYIVGWYSEGLTKHQKWYEGDKWETELDKYCDPYAPVVNQEYIAKFPEYKYSAYDIYDGVDILQYLRIYEKYPQTEYLVKLGLSKYAKSKQILRKVEKDKGFRKFLAVNRAELNKDFYYISAILKAYKNGKSLKEAQAYESAKKELQKQSGYTNIQELFSGDYEKYFAYIGKQQISNNLYRDYLNACNYLGLDMSEEKNRFPHDFKKWHDIRIDEYATTKALKDEEERKELYAKFSAIAEKYMPLQEEKKSVYIAVIPQSPADLIREGDVLNHCVGRMGYEQKFVREETLIFFIRSKELPDKPFVTIEYSLKNKKVLQCYAYHNQTPDKAVMQYVNKVWLPYANRALKKISA